MAAILRPIENKYFLGSPITGRYVDGMLKLWSYVTLDNGEYKVITEADDEYLYSYTCPLEKADYVLYYLNSYGGWNSFVIEGTTVKKENITQYTTDKVFDNTTYEFEKDRYVSEINTSYELNTGLLSDVEAANLSKNLISSNKVYLHSLNEGYITNGVDWYAIPNFIKPVVITDTSVVYQTYTTNGKKLAQYKISVSDSQSKIRK